MANNKVENISDLEPLKSNTKLVNLDLDQNPVAKSEGYREKVFALISSLIVLDGVDKEGNECLSDDSGEEEEEEEEGDDQFIEDEELSQGAIAKMKEEGFEFEEEEEEAEGEGDKAEGEAKRAKTEE